MALKPESYPDYIIVYDEYSGKQQIAYNATEMWDEDTEYATPVYVIMEHYEGIVDTANRFGDNLAKD